MKVALTLYPLIVKQATKKKPQETKAVSFPTASQPFHSPITV